MLTDDHVIMTTTLARCRAMSNYHVDGAEIWKCSQAPNKLQFEKVEH